MTNKRLETLDVLRGFALLGILLMNIQSFAMPGAAYLNPTAYGDLTGINNLVWALCHVFADQKFMSLFSIMFGAGVLLFCQNAEAKTGYSAGLHYRRTFWLLVFGLLHGYLFWYGDILYAYAMCGFIIYLFRNKSIKTLLITALVLLLISTAYNVLMSLSIPHFPPEGMQGLNDAWSPNEVSIKKEMDAYKGGFLSALEYRAEETIFMQTFVFLTMFIWRATAMMLLGMALFKSGFFHLDWSKKQYQRLAVFGLIFGVGLVSFGVFQHYERGFPVAYSMFVGAQYNYWGSILIALGYAAVIMLWVQAGFWKGLERRLKAIGKTAFTNYIMHTLIATTIFYGYGFNLFGEMERWQQLSMVFAIWALQLWLSPLWLKHYRFGPLEWLWRCLTYKHWQSMKLTH